VLGLGCVFLAAFIAVAAAARPHGLQRPDFAVAVILLAVGAATAVGCARLLAVLRASLTHRQRELTDLSAGSWRYRRTSAPRSRADLHDEFGQSLTASTRISG
jgi:hypothetical protein